MSKKNLIIHLQNKTKAFSINTQQVDRIRKIYPDYNIINCLTKDDFIAQLPTATIVICWTFLPEWYALAPLLTAMHTPAAGHNWAKKDPTGKVPSYYGSFHGKIMAKSLLSMILYFNRRIPQTFANQHKKLWDRSIFDNTKTFTNQQILIVGYGNIGHEVTRILKFFGTKIIAVKRDISTAKDDPNIDNAITFKQIHSVLNTTDHIVFILPDDTNTDNIFTADHFAKLKPGACLYNIGRGNCYKETDLINALKNGNLSGAGLDVFANEPLPKNSELWTLDNVLITPHSSAVADEYLDYYIDELGLAE